MARPIKQGLDYFPHDTDAVADEKIDAMRALHGNDGYAFYFILLERCYSTATGELDLSKPAIFASIIKKIMVSKELFLEMLETAFDVELFDRQAWEERKVITSNGVRKRVEKVEEERAEKRSKYSKRKGSAVQNSGEMPPKEEKENSFSEVSEVQNSGEMPQSKVKKSKEKQSKVNDDDNTCAGARETMSIYDYYTHCGFGTASGIAIEEIQDLVERFSEPWVRMALKESSDQGVHNRAYAKAILERWKAGGGPDKPKNRGKPPDKQNWTTPESWLAIRRAMNDG